MQETSKPPERQRLVRAKRGATSPARLGRPLERFPDVGTTADDRRRAGRWLRIEVVGHSLEVSARIGSARFETRFGILRVELDDELPAAVAIACVGRRIDEVVDHEVLRGRGWIIEAVEDTSAPSVGQSFLVRTASVTCGVPSDERS